MVGFLLFGRTVRLRPPKNHTRMAELSMLGVLLTICVAAPAVAQLREGVLSGIVRDSSGLPLPGALVQVDRARGGGHAETTADGQGRYVLAAPGAGDYIVQASLAGFRPAVRHLTLAAGQRVVVDLQLQVATLSQSVTVSGEPGRPSTFSRVLVTRDDLDHVPGALMAGSCTAITQLSPSAVVAHDQLHVRGGHQVGYAIDGVPVPSTSIGSNFALLVDPKDVDGIDFQRGAYSAEYGDRLYGLVDVITRSGFERAKGGESTLIGGERRTVEGAAAYGDHTDSVAYFAQVSGNRSDFGLTPPAMPTENDATWGAGQGTRLWIGHGSARTLTITESARADDYTIPNDVAMGSAVTGNRQAQRDAYVHAQWTHAGATGGVWSLTPYYHFNRVALNAGPPEGTTASSDDRRIHYLGAKADRSVAFGRHLLKAGVDGYAAFLRDRFLLPLGDRESPGAPARMVEDAVTRTGVNMAAYVEDAYQMANQVTVTAGVRWDRTQAWQTESALHPRVGMQAKIPATPLVAHVYAGRFFQPPPFEALGVGGADFAAHGGQAFLLVRAERNTQWETGVTWPVSGGSLDLTYYDNHARNFLDHEQLGQSSVFLPVNLASARLRGVEVTASSAPGKRLRARLVLAHTYAQARGGVTGGLGDIDAGNDTGWVFLDEDQRNSAVASLDWTITRRVWTHAALEYGSGFLLARGPSHLPSHVTADLSGGITLGDRWSVAADVMNVTDRRYFIDLSSEFNGTHVARPRTAVIRACRRF